MKEKLREIKGIFLGEYAEAEQPIGFVNQKGTIDMLEQVISDILYEQNEWQSMGCPSRDIGISYSTRLEKTIDEECIKLLA